MVWAQHRCRRHQVNYDLRILLLVLSVAHRALIQTFPACGLGVSVATDGVLYQTSIFEASHTSPTSEPDSETESLSWGDRPVLLLLGLRLGLDGVNPIYYDTIKVLLCRLHVAQH